MTIWDAAQQHIPVQTPEGIICVILTIKDGIAKVRSRRGQTIIEAKIPITKLRLLDEEQKAS